MSRKALRSLKKNSKGQTSVTVYLNETQIEMVNTLLKRGTWGILPFHVVARLVDNALQQQFPQGLEQTKLP